MTNKWLVIGLMGAVTLATRLGGVSMARYIPQTPAWRRFMHHLPTTLLVAIAAPAFFSGDLVLTAAAAVTLLVAAAGLHLVGSMTVGVLTVAFLRWLT
jgi:uncharacterized membrane protein